MQSPSPLVMVTSKPVLLQLPLATNVTGSPELAVGATVKLVPYAAGLVGWSKVMV